ncbi:MAG: PAS domain S-box protein [Azonexus sp.]
MRTTLPGTPKDNLLLAALPLADYLRLEGEFEKVSLSAGEVLHEAGATLDFLYFPVSGIVSLRSITADGASSEIAIVGNDGVVGVSAVLGEDRSAHQAVAQRAGHAYRIRIEPMRSELDQGGALLRTALRYVQSLMTQIERNAAASSQIATRSAPNVPYAQGPSSTLFTQGKLRKTAEDRLPQTLSGSASQPTDTHRLVHELQVHKIELELQNEALARAYAEADAARQRYAEIYDFSPIALVTVDAQGAICQINLAGATLIGIKHTEFRRYRFGTSVAPESVVVFNEFLEKVLRERSQQVCEITLSATAQRPAAIITIDAVPDENGRECRMVVVDVTQERQATRRLREREQYQRALLDTFPFIVWLKDEQGNFLSVNQPFAATFGWPSAESLVGKSDLDIASLELAESYRTDDREVLESGEPRIIEEWNETGDELRWFETFKSPVVLDGQILGTVGYARDLTEYKIMVAALRNSEEEFRSLFELSVVGSIQADPLTGQLLRVNRKFCEITGYSAEELLAQSVDVITHPEDRERSWQGFRAVMVGETDLFVIDKRYVRKDGSIVWVNVQLTAVRDEQNHVTRSIAVIQDITIQKRAEAALRDQLKMQDILSKIAATVPGVICSFLLRPDGTACMPYASPALYELYGLQPEDVRDDATPLLARIHADDIGMVNEAIAASVGAMTPWRAEYRVHHPSKGILWVDGHSMPQREPDGSILWQGYLMDITARKHSEEALRESERIYRAIGESIDYGIWICAADGRNLYASDSFLNMVGITQEQCSNFGWGDVLHPDDAERTIAAWKECAQTGADWDIEHRFRGVDGLWHEVLARGVAVRNEVGQITHWAGINLDISRLKRVENALRESERDLQQAQAVAQTGSWRLYVKQNELRWSDENYRIFGVPKGTPLTYETFLSIVHPDDRSFVDKTWRDALLGAPYDIEHRIVVAGEIKWVNERTELEFDPQGNLLGGFGSTQDINERKRSEAALFASESRFRLAMEAISGVVYDWDKRTGSTYWSSGLLRVFGVSGLDAESGRRWWRENVNSDDLVRIRPEILRVLRTRCDSLQLEYRMRHSAGHWLHILDCARIVRDSSGRVVRVIGSLTDVSGRKHAEEDLRRFNDSLEELVAQRTAEVEERSRALLESERFARATIDALSSSVCVLDGTGHIIAVNKAWREFAQNNGVQFEQVCEGADYLAICDAASGTSDPVAAQVATAIREFIAGRRQDFSAEYECHSPETRRWFAMKLSCFPGDGQLRLVAKHEEITERKLAAEEQQESAKRLQRLAAHLETVREEQSATIAREVHDELGGTLTMVKLSLAIVANGVAESTPLQDSLRGILDQIDMALQTIKRISAELRPATLDTLGLVATIKWHVSQFSKMTGIATDLHLPENIKLSRDRSTAIFRIIQEALTNVAKHAGASTAFVAISKHGGELIIEIRDNGIGITKSNRVKPDSFGLIGMRERALYLGGELSVTGMPNAGTRLNLRIPLDD